MPMVKLQMSPSVAAIVKVRPVTGTGMLPKPVIGR